NYVMLELGQPNHVFDLDTIPNGHLRVRRATEGEAMVTLDGAERTLISLDGVIANGSDEAISLAGVMGGHDTEVTDSTTSVLLEMAWWDPPSISRTIKRHNLPSEASTRFRRGADWGENIDRAMDRFCELIAQTGATIAPGQIDVPGTTPQQGHSTARVSKMNSLLGTDMTAEEMVGHLSSIGFTTTAAGDDLTVTVPSWRWDALGGNAHEFESSIAEEIGRLYGYEDIPKTVPRGEETGHLTDYQKNRRAVREALLGMGCDETLPMPFLGPEDLSLVGLPDDGVRLTNPLDANESVLRTSLLPGQLKAIAYNQSHRNPSVRFFETGQVFLPPREGELLPDEREYLAVALEGAEAPEAVSVLNTLARVLALPNVKLFNVDDLPGMHPGRAAEVVIAGKARGVVGEVAPSVLRSFEVSGRVAWLQLDLGEILRGPHGKRNYRPVSKFPSSDMDLAFVVADDVGADKVRNTIAKSAGELLVDLRLVDAYRGAGLPEDSRSLAFALRLQAADRTLTDAEITATRDAVIAAVAKTNNGTLRA
ncbi:MAG: phenylalanine--tRNA ligase subunit beta, partial [Acidimicrobiales bacterium]|nr:phenylalanine--tRNA ligase subunit beta [Acidimicrobiales bacterium]